MADNTMQNEPLFQLSVTTRVAATPDEVYAVISDLSRSGEWSIECQGGRWISGEPATVGAVFQGDNFRSADVVGWSPVVRGKWTTESQVVTAEPGQTFQWAMRDSAGRAQESVWGYRVEPDGADSLLTHHFRMGAPTEGIRGITAGMNDVDNARFFVEWTAKLERDMAATLDRVKAVIESSADRVSFSRV